MTPAGAEVSAVEQKSEPHDKHRRQRACPECGETQVRRSRRRSLRDHLLSLIGMRPYRCHDCGHRFHIRGRTRSQPRRKYSRWALCPRCGFSGVSRIARSKVPHTWANLPWRVLPVFSYRCPECRKRFFDYRPAQPKEAGQHP